LLVDYGGKTFLIDPYLAEKDANPGLKGTLDSHIRNPLVELKMPMEEILTVDAVIVTHTHTHPDHRDEAAARLLPKHLLILARHEQDATLIASHLETVNHCVLTRDALRAFVNAHDMGERVLVPEDDQAYDF